MTELESVPARRFPAHRCVPHGPLAARIGGPVWALALLAGLFFAPAGAAAQGNDSLEVAIGALDGKGLRDREISQYQAQLKRIEGVKIQATSKLRKAAGKRKLKAESLPGDRQGIQDVCGDLGLGAIIFGKLEDAPGGGRNKVLNLSVYACRNGEQVGGTKSVDVPKGSFVRGVWEGSARAVAEDLFAIMDGTAFAPPPPPPPPPVERRPPPPRKAAPPPPPEFERTRPVVRVRAGLALLSRTFSAMFKAGTVPQGKEQLKYESSTVPGFAFDLEAYPLEAVTHGALAGLGLGVRMEKVFLSTKAVEPDPDNAGASKVVDLPTSHLHALVRLMYRRAITQSEAPVEVHGHLGMGWLNFETPDNTEYRGATYTYLSLGGGASVPVVGKLVVLEADVAVLPLASLGDLATELGKDVSNFGFRVGGGISSTLPLFGITAAALVEYTSISSTPTGAGRATGTPPPGGQPLVGREGTEASDAYLGMRLMLGYNF